jgi:hypothetical protein
MSQAPWFKFYAADYMSSPFVQALDPEQELWYLRLIIASAISLPRGCLPLANGKLWRLAKATSEEYFEQNAGAILAKFERDEVAEVYRVPKVASQQLLTSSELSMKRSEAGKRGAANRWQSAICGDGKLPSETMANAKQNIADSDSDSDLDINPSSEQKNCSDVVILPSKNPKSKPSREATAKPTGDQIEQIYQIYPRRVGKGTATTAIRNAVRKVMAGDPDHPALPLDEALDYLAQRVGLYKQSIQGDDPKYTPHPASWFNGERFWDDEWDWGNKQNRKSSAPVPLPADYVSPSKEILRERAAAAAQ